MARSRSTEAAAPARVAGGARELSGFELLPIEENPVRRANPALAVEQDLPELLVLTAQLEQRRLDRRRIDADDAPVVGESLECAADMDHHCRRSFSDECVDVDSRLMTS